MKTSIALWIAALCILGSGQNVLACATCAAHNPPAAPEASADDAAKTKCCAGEDNCTEACKAKKKAESLSACCAKAIADGKEPCCAKAKAKGKKACCAKAEAKDKKACCAKADAKGKKACCAKADDDETEGSKKD